MGYDFHITRRDHWSNAGKDIADQEWLAVIAGDPELHLDPKHGPYFAVWNGVSALASPWLDWSEGQISTKNPDDALIDKMVAIAQKLGAKVQGDDGEFYHSSQDAHKPTDAAIKPAAIQYFLRLFSWFERHFSRSKAPTPPFKVGDRVIDHTNREIATVQMINRRAEHGAGIVRVRFDDGREYSYWLIAHPFTPVGQENLSSSNASRRIADR